MAGRIKSSDVPELNARQLQALQARSPSANDILTHMDGLNEEIAEQAEVKGTELVSPDLQAVEAAVTEAGRELTPAEIRQMRGTNKTLITIDEVQESPVTQSLEALEAENAELDRRLEEQRARRAAEAAQAPEASEKPQVDEEPDIATQVLQMLKDAPGAPSEAQIAAWKREHGEGGVQVLAMGVGDVYVFTFLRRKAFQQVQAAIAKRAQLEGIGGDPEEYMMEQVLKQCILYPRPLSIEFFYNSRSGVVPTLYNSIMLHSYHLSPQQAMVLTTQL